MISEARAAMYMNLTYFSAPDIDANDKLCKVGALGLKDSQVFHCGSRSDQAIHFKAGGI
tara:strand:+ start:232 stop:408 length:177 start_codon:yes stop_codon:yes gene_type:complete